MKGKGNHRHDALGTYFLSVQYMGKNVDMGRHWLCRKPHNLNPAPSLLSLSLGLFTLSLHHS